MNRMKKRVASGIVAALVLLPVTAAHAEDLESAHRAGQYVAAQVSGAATGETGSTIDSILALFATGDPELAAVADQMVETVKSQAGTYAESGPEAAAKLSILASALGEDPSSFFGLDLVKGITDAVGDDGSFGAFPGAFSSSLGIIALGRAGADIPEKMVSFLISGANTDGGYGYAADQPSDADSTGMVLQALSVVPETADADKAEAGAAEWATSNQAEDGSWAGYNPINSTAMAGMGLLAAGQPNDRAVGYLVSQQMEDGAMPDNGEANLLATSQAALLLGGVSYVDVVRPVGDATPEQDGQTAAEAPPEASDAPAQPAEDKPSGGVSPLAWGAGVVVVVGLGAWLAVRRRTNA